MSRKSHQTRSTKTQGRINRDESDGTSELLNFLKQQSEYIDQVERENKFLKDELSAFGKRLDEVIRENQKLHDSIRADAVRDTINRASLVVEENQREFSEQNDRQLFEKYQSLHESHLMQEPSASKRETLKQWTQEMKNVKSIYEAKMEGLQAEVTTTKNDLKNALNDGAALRERIQALEALLKTPKYDANSPSLAYLQKEDLSLNANVPLIERLTKERDDLMKSVSSMRSSVMEAQKTESSLRKEVQKSLALVEDMQLEKAQAKIENDRLRKNLELTRQRLETEITSAQKRITEATTQQRKTCQDEINELAKKVGELTTISTMYEDTIQSAGKEKATLSAQLQESRKQLMTANEDLGKMRAEIDHEVRSALKGYKGAEDELRAAKIKLQEELSRTQQERVRLEQEAVDQHRRLTATEAEALSSKELNVTLTQQLNATLNKLQKCKNERERIEKGLKEKYEEFQIQAESKETYLEDVIRKSTIEHQQRLSDLENISSKQANLIKKLREEGKLMESELTRVSKKYRKQLGTLSQDKDAAMARLDRLLIANKELEEQVVQHGITHREMQVRLRTLDERTRRTTGYAAGVAEENDQLCLDKSLLQKEVEFLQSQVLNQSC